MKGNVLIAPIGLCVNGIIGWTNSAIFQVCPMLKRIPSVNGVVVSRNSVKSSLFAMKAIKMTKKKKIRTRRGDEYETYQIGTCENCLKESVRVRKIQAFSTFVSASPESSRGWYNLCFECFGPRVKFWSEKRQYEAPTNIIRAPAGLEEFAVLSRE